MLTCLAFPAVLLQILSSLESPHIVKYFDSFLHEGRLHIVSCQSSPCHFSLAALSAAGMLRDPCVCPLRTCPQHPSCPNVV